MISVHDDKLVDDFVVDFSRIVHQLEVLGDLVDDNKIMAKYFYVVPHTSSRKLRSPLRRSSTSKCCQSRRSQDD